MPTTNNGTAYTTYRLALAGHGTVCWTIGDDFVDSENIPTILFAHGSGGDPDQWATLPSAQGIREAWLDGGGLVIEGGGDNTDILGQQNWGNSGARAAYMAYLEYVSGILSVGDVVAVGRSMGGLITAWLTARSPIKSRFSGWINMSGVSTMLVGDSSGSGVQVNTVRHFGSTLWSAYGQTSYVNASAAVLDGGHAPEAWPATDWAGTNILSLYGDADTTVPWETRGGKPLTEIWSGQPAISRVVRRIGGDHGGNSTWLNVSEMIDFLADVTDFVPFVPSNPVVYEIAGAYVAGNDGEWYALDTNPVE